MATDGGEASPLPLSAPLLFLPCEFSLGAQSWKKIWEIGPWGWGSVWVESGEGDISGSVRAGHGRRNSSKTRRRLARQGDRLGLWDSGCRCQSAGHLLGHQSRVLLAEAGSADGLGWGWEGDALALAEEHGLELIRNHTVHDRAVAVAIDVSLNTLQGIGPTDLAHLVAHEAPVREALEVVPEVEGVLGADEVDEGVAETGLSVVVHGEVDEVVLGVEAFFVEKVDEHGASEVVWDVSHHDGSPGLLLGGGVVTVLTVRSGGFRGETQLFDLLGGRLSAAGLLLFLALRSVFALVGKLILLFVLINIFLELDCGRVEACPPGGEIWQYIRSLAAPQGGHPRFDRCLPQARGGPPVGRSAGVVRFWQRSKPVVQLLPGLVLGYIVNSLGGHLVIVVIRAARARFPHVWAQSRQDDLLEPRRGRLDDASDEAEAWRRGWHGRCATLDVDLPRDIVPRRGDSFGHR
mmetsp:Transcript_18191/g.38896  ORF Transcript_18191/g.38896 Transcript_18191/m.38896 type:complete len:463 (-) Transcript_18191:137-1525(-)